MYACIYEHSHGAAAFAGVLGDGEVGDGLAEQAEGGADLGLGHLARRVRIVAVAAGWIFVTQSECIQSLKQLCCLDSFATALVLLRV
jgi:hypothetical protein